jgi:rRNA-processing protein FCF1
VPQSVIAELDELVRAGVRNARGARELAERFEVVPSRGEGDAAILALARRRTAWVVTADAELGERLRSAGVPLLVPRRPDRLERRLPR